MSPRSGGRALRAVGFLALLASIAGLAGCGDRELWARYRAEQRYWQAQRELGRLFVNPRVARPADFARAESAFRRVVAEFPPERWSGAAVGTTAGDVGEIAGRSELALARLANLQGRTREAAAGYARVTREWSGHADLTLESEVLLSGALASSGDSAGARAALERIARRYDPVGANGMVRAAVLDASLRLALGWNAPGEAERRDSLLEADEARLSSAAARAHGRSAAAGLLDALGGRRELGGDLEGALAAWRQALFEPAPDSARARRVLQFGERWLARGRPDSALGWAGWAARDFGGPTRLAGLELAALAQRRLDRPDSALAVYDRILSGFQRDANATADARFERAQVYESEGQWAQARVEYSALCAAQPTHPRAVDAWVLVVQHYREAHEEEMARMESAHALAAMDQLLATQYDPGVRRRAGEGRAAVLLAAGRTREAIDALRAAWEAGGVSLWGGGLGARAARAAAGELHDEALARGLWQILSERAPDPALREQARAALSRAPS